MKRRLLISYAVVTPLAVAGGLIYKVAHGELTDPYLYLLIVVFPAVLKTAIEQSTSLIPPSRLTVRFLADGQTYHWTEAVPGAGGAGRDVVTVTLPVRIENHDSDKSVSLLDVQVRDKDGDARLYPPDPIHIDVGGEKHWVFPAGSSAYSEILNSGRQVAVDHNSIVDSHVVVKYDECERSSYMLELRFRDTYGRDYTCETLIT